MDHQRTHVELRPQLAHPLCLQGVDFRRAPHARARGENLERVRADLLRTFHGVRRSARRPQMNPDSLGHAISLMGRIRGFRHRHCGSELVCDRACLSAPWIGISIDPVLALAGSYTTMRKKTARAGKSSARCAEIAPPETISFWYCSAGR